MSTVEPGIPLIPVLDRPWQTRRWLDICWVVLMAFFLFYGLNLYRSGWLCAYMGTDFRGYYASAQIAWQRGFSAVYDQDIQSEYQAALLHRCPEPAVSQPVPRVFTPYLPVFIVFFLPLVLFDFSAGYLTWVVLNLAVLVIYLLHFSQALGERINHFQLIQWIICVPMISNLFLGQMNVWLVICVGEFFLFMLRGRYTWSGLWLGGMLLKPHTLLLILPGLVISQNWGILLGFMISLMFILGLSLLLVGVQGLAANFLLIGRFAGPLIKTAASMMNYRALALNLDMLLPLQVAWGGAIAIAAMMIFLILRQWLRLVKGSELQWGYLIMVTLLGTLAVSWHSHFYMLVCLLPLLVFLDIQGELPLNLKSMWMIAPFILYGLLLLLRLDLIRNWFGLGLLALSQILLFWALWKLSKGRWGSRSTA